MLFSLDFRYKQAINMDPYINDSFIKKIKKFINNGPLNKKDKKSFCIAFDIYRHNGLRHHTECLLLTKESLEKCSIVSGIPQDILEIYRSIFFSTNEVPDAVIIDYIDNLATERTVNGKIIQDTNLLKIKREKKISYELGFDICALILYGKIINKDRIIDLMKNNLVIDYFNDKLNKEKIAAYKLFTELEESKNDSNETINVALKIIQESMSSVSK